ncbi:uncharacterized protein LOC107637693 isoform X2 [Arachis ipaensis]|uniref:uncharacterized protein LOC107637693 isoform X2 n=1 Tax=Arachis ipaensis TaxID=130454 RepID=UPI000A2B2A0D|nr:uncharacterized protein LOC107637693 isoform X2 [Arachis ipaensis]XP_025646856.1 uncharacterized protein LOC112741899 isoform X2 [Arachis hypogaea]
MNPSASYRLCRLEPRRRTWWPETATEAGVVCYRELPPPDPHRSYCHSPPLVLFVAVLAIWSGCIASFTVTLTGSGAGVAGTTIGDAATRCSSSLVANHRRDYRCLIWPFFLSFVLLWLPREWLGAKVAWLVISV